MSHRKSETRLKYFQCFDSIYLIIVLWMRTRSERCFNFRGEKLLKNDAENNLICENTAA